MNEWLDRRADLGGANTKVPLKLDRFYPLLLIVTFLKTKITFGVFLQDPTPLDNAVLGRVKLPYAIAPYDGIIKRQPYALFVKLREDPTLPVMVQ